MKLYDVLALTARRAGKLAGRTKASPFWDVMLPSDEGVRLRGEYRGALAEVFFGNQEQVVHKWLHYLAIYERYFAQFRGTGFRMLEIGVSKGGSLNMWRKYFGPQATIVGIDVDPACATVADPPNRVRIGSQADPAFLRDVVAEMGGIDVVLDDGSHIAEHQQASFECLFPLLEDGGLYAIEDMHTAYWPGQFQGGYRRRGTAIEMMKSAVDDMHHWYHDRGVKWPAGDHIAAVHFFDSITLIEKQAPKAPRHIQIGRREEITPPPLALS